MAWETVFIIGSILGYAGALISGALGIMQIKRWLKDKPNLSIELELVDVARGKGNEDSMVYSPAFTEIKIDVSFNNNGSQPITITGVKLYSKAKEFNEVRGSIIYNNYSFPKIRLEKNDREEKMIIFSKDTYLEPGEFPMETKIVFETSTGKFEKEIKIIDES